IVVTVIAGGDCAADDGCANEAGSNAPAPADRLGLRLGGGSDRAGNGKGRESESGKLGLDRHLETPSCVRRPLWSACRVGRNIFESGSMRRLEIWFRRLFLRNFR